MRHGTGPILMPIFVDADTVLGPRKTEFKWEDAEYDLTC